MPKEETIEIINRENDPCETCGYAEGSPFCLQYCPYDAERKKEQEPCDDAISREHLLSEIGELKQSPWFNRGKLYDINNPDFQHAMYLERKEAVEMIEDICIKKEPSVQPSRKGHWITEGIHWKPIFKCSECGSVIEEMPTVMDKPKYRGCPYCLAEMESNI